MLTLVLRGPSSSHSKVVPLADAIRISDRHGWPRYQSLQPLYNLYDRSDYESDWEPVCVKNGIGVITYFSLASGFLTGKYPLSAPPASRNWLSS